MELLILILSLYIILFLLSIKLKDNSIVDVFWWIWFIIISIYLFLNNSNIEIEKIIKKNNKIKVLGYLNDADLNVLYQQALFFIYPSIWEGFGYPVLEAIQNGTPVAVSNSSSLVEIAEDNALYFDPMSIQSIAQAMKRLINNAQLRENLISKGLIHAKQFTWKKYYNQLIETLLLNSKK